MAIRVEKSGKTTTVFHHRPIASRTMKKEWENGMAILTTEGVQGAARFTREGGCHGGFAGLEG